MKKKENKNHKNKEQPKDNRLEIGNSDGSSIFNDNYPTLLAFDLVRHLPTEPVERKNDQKKLGSYRDDPETLKAIERFKSYSSKFKPPIE